MLETNKGGISMEKKEILLAITELKSTINNRFDALYKQFDKGVSEEFDKTRQNPDTVDGQQSEDTRKQLDKIEKDIKILNQNVRFLAQKLGQHEMNLNCTENKDEKQIIAEQMIIHTKNMENGERIEFLHYLSDTHFKRWEPTEDMILPVQYHIEDRIDRNLSEEEIEIMTVAYRNGYSIGFDAGMEKVFKSGVYE